MPYCRIVMANIGMIIFDLLFSDEGRLTWMYKDKVENDEYLLGRRIDSSALADAEPDVQSKLHCFIFHVFLCALNL